jgi:hypothetical protein
MTDSPWDDPTRKRYYAIPFELAYEAVLYNVPIGKTCIDALKQAIREKKASLRNDLLSKSHIKPQNLPVSSK